MVSIYNLFTHSSLVKVHANAPRILYEKKIPGPRVGKKVVIPIVDVE
jgi:hypothetical protein